MSAESKAEPAPNGKDLQELQDLYDVMKAEGLDVLELKRADSRIRLSRQVPAAPAAEAPRRAAAVGAAPAPKASADSVKGDAIKSPLAGVFYRAGSPSSPAFVKEGDTVDAGQTLCIVEAMKVMNEIKSDKRCRIVKIAAENSRPVTVEQVLFWIEPA